MIEARDPFDEILNTPLPPIATVPATTPAKILKRREHFIMVPVAWDDRLTGCTGHTYKVALRVLYLNWKTNNKPFPLPNGMLKYDRVSRQSKWRCLAVLERLGLITIERRPNKSPTIHVHLEPPNTISSVRQGSVSSVRQVFGKVSQL
jgi:hypothetical protein